MANIERSLLYAGTGFLIGLYLMTRMSFLRPATAQSMSSLPQYPPDRWQPPYSPQSQQTVMKYPPDQWIGERPS